MPPKPNLTSGEATEMSTVGHETETRGGDAAEDMEGVEAAPTYDGGDGKSEQVQPSGGQSDMVEETEGSKCVEGELSQSPGLRNFAPQFELEVRTCMYCKCVQVYQMSIISLFLLAAFTYIYMCLLFHAHTV